MELSPLTRTADHMQIGRSHQSPLVGRDEEIAQLKTFLQRTEQMRRLKLVGQRRASLFSPHALDAPRRPQGVILMGDVGIGKTRLAEEASREAKRRDWAVAWCRAYTQESNVPYRMWTEILRKAMSQGLWQRQELARRPLIYQPLRQLLPELQDLLPQALHIMPVAPEQEQLRLWEATRALLGAICENTTLLIVLDDVQWADSSSCELLTYLVRQMRGLPVMFLCTCRDTELPSNHHLRPMFTDMTREQAIELLTVAPLSHDEIRELIAHLPATVVESISSRASGNPFFAEELARGVAAGDLELDPTNPDELPETITAVLDLRLARITQPCRKLLERAAVLGDAFQFETIYAMASGGAPADEDQILDLIEEALQSGMLTEEGNGPNISYTFWHPLLLTYLYEHLSAARRASLHRRAAQVMQEHYAGRESEGAAEITHHLINGGAAHPVVAHYAELAADRAYALSAYPSAERHYRLTLDYLGPLTRQAEPPERLHYASIWERLGECTMIVGKFEEARTFYEQTLATRSGQRVLLSADERVYEAQIAALLWCEISRAWRYLGNSEQARESVRQGEKVLQEAGVEAGPAWARIRYQQGHTLWLEGNLNKALNMGNEALQRFEASSAQPPQAETSLPSTQAQRILNGDPVGLGRVYTLLAGVTATLGQNAVALDHLNQALAVFEKNEVKNEIANVCCNLGDLHLKRAEYSLARSMLMRSHKLAEEIGLVPIMSVALNNLGVLAARLGNLSEAENWYQQSLVLTEQVNDLFYISLFRSYVAIALIEQGKLDEAEPLLVQALKISHAKRISPCTGFALVALGHLRLARALAREPRQKEEQGEAQARLLRRARATLQRALTFDGLEADVRLGGQLHLAHIALLLGEIEQGRELAEMAREEARESELVWLQARAQVLLAQAHSAADEPEAAASLFQTALATFARTGMRLEHARALCASASSLLPTSEPSTRLTALAQLREALATFQECQAALDAQAAERLLALHREPATRGRKPGRKGR